MDKSPATGGIRIVDQDRKTLRYAGVYAANGDPGRPVFAITGRPRGSQVDLVVRGAAEPAEEVEAAPAARAGRLMPGDACWRMVVTRAQPEKERDAGQVEHVPSAAARAERMPT